MEADNNESEKAQIKKEKKAEKVIDNILLQELDINKDELKQLKKKLAKVETRSERGTETLFRLVSKNQYTLNSMIDKKANILISINALILSIIIGTVLPRLEADPHLIYPAIMILVTDLASIAFAVFATRPELEHGKKGSGNKFTLSTNLMFHGNFNQLKEEEYTEKLTSLIYKGDELYNQIAIDTYNLGLAINKRFKYIRKSFDIFLIGLILSVLAFIACHMFF